MMRMKNKATVFLLRILQGILIGGGAMLPGVSGGVLAVIFGVYMPFMELLTSPVKAVKKHIWLFAPVLAGGVLGFLVAAKLVSAAFAGWEKYVTCLFAGIILGTVKSLYRSAARDGVTKGCYVAMFAACAAITALLASIKYLSSVNITPGFLWFLFSGAIWGLSLIVPGMNSSSVLIFLGLYQPMTDGISRLDFGVIIPVACGLLIVALLLARAVRKLYDKYYSVMWCGVIGLVLGSSIMILPFEFASYSELFVCLLCALGGFSASMALNRLQDKIKV